MGRDAKGKYEMNKKENERESMTHANEPLGSATQTEGRAWGEEGEGAIFPLVPCVSDLP